MEGVLACELLEVLVGADTAGLECLGRDLVGLAADQVHTQGELLDGALLQALVEDSIQKKVNEY